MRRIRLLQGGLQIANVLDHPLDHLELRQFPLARHVRDEGAQLRQISGHFLGLEVASGAADPQAIVQDAAMIGRHSAAHRTHHHRLHAGRTLAYKQFLATVSSKKKTSQVTQKGLGEIDQSQVEEEDEAERERRRKTWECLVENYSVECILASDDCAPAARVVGLSFGVHVRLARVSCGATLPIPGCLQDCNIVSGRGMINPYFGGPLGPYPTFGTNTRSIWYFSGVLEHGGGGEGERYTLSWKHGYFVRCDALCVVLTEIQGSSMGRTVTPARRLLQVIEVWLSLYNVYRQIVLEYHGVLEYCRNKTPAHTANVAWSSPGKFFLPVICFQLKHFIKDNRGERKIRPYIYIYKEKASNRERAIIVLSRNS
ncbi:hypothetical protein ALC62_04682 [Cyphomyrmex costatus]|uniref:Uncharacterized protein n=1 Tax=Cyphomyrmex costatus TaxID=456900 RepID=A0A195CUU8_9HYME|nr:hypothetical protein ALC62_04682 [Cyphomyrmex costatus]